MDNKVVNMDEDKIALVQKILKDIDNVMSKNAHIIAFDIVPVEINIQNKSPVLHMDNCLGLEAWCVKHVYLYCYKELKEKYLTKRKWNLSTDKERLEKLLSITILLNPDLTTLWNRRRELFLNDSLDRNKEFRFTRMVLSRKPKCNDAYSYRRWLIEYILADDTLPGRIIESLAGDELFLCRGTVANCPNNYHSWNHRMWTVNRVKAFRDKFDISRILLSEYNITKKEITQNISDHSCYHYREFCVKNIYELNSFTWDFFKSQLDFNIKRCFLRSIFDWKRVDFVKLQALPEEKLLEEIMHTLPAESCNCEVDMTLFCRKFELLYFELVLNDDLMVRYPKHETLWYHRRFIVHEIFTVMYEYFGLVREKGVILKHVCKKCYPDDFRERQAKVGRCDDSKVYSTLMFKVLIEHEKRFIEEMRTKDVYTIRYKKYLKHILGLKEVMKVSNDI